MKLKIEEAEKKAFLKTGLVVGVFFFFIYLFLMNFINQLIFNFPNSRIFGYLVFIPFAAISFLLIKKFLKSTLVVTSKINEFDAEKLKKANNFQVKIGIVMGLYALLMFVLTRMTNIYLF